jgi:dipeptidyl-peptidase-4
MRRSLIVWTLAALAVSPVAAEQPPAPPSIGALLTPEAGGRRPTLPAWSPDGKRLGYVWEKSLSVLDLATGRSEVVWGKKDGKDSKDDKDAKEEIDAYAWSPKGDAILLVIGGDLYLESLDDHEVRRLTRTEAEEKDPRFSPDGRHIAYVRDFDLYVMDVERGGELRLTSDGQENVALNGTNDWVYEEEIWDRTPEGFWWSPDSSHIALPLRRVAGRRLPPGGRHPALSQGESAEVPQGGRAQSPGQGGGGRHHDPADDLARH